MFPLLSSNFTFQENDAFRYGQRLRNFLLSFFLHFVLTWFLFWVCLFVCVFFKGPQLQIQGLGRPRWRLSKCDRHSNPAKKDSADRCCWEKVAKCDSCGRICRSIVVLFSHARRCIGLNFVYFNKQYKHDTNDEIIFDKRAQKALHMSVL